MQTIEVKTTSIRMPIELVNWISAYAKRNYRDFSKEVVNILQEKRNEIEKQNA